MKVSRFVLMLLLMFLACIGFSDNTFAKDEVGSVIALKGKAMIDRDRKSIEAKVKDGILLNDIVSTLQASRVKMFFIDDSVLTLGEKTKVSIKEFVYSKEKGGTSIINLIDGKLRAVVGKTNFEVHTPTAVAAARGTVIGFETGIIDGKKFTRIVCYEGTVHVMSAYAGIVGSATLEPGMSIIIFDGEQIPQPTLTPAGEGENLWNGTDISNNEVTIPGPAEIILAPGFVAIEPAPAAPPFNQQPPSPATTNINIDVIFP
jgi:hypothetical protein